MHMLMWLAGYIARIWQFQKGKEADTRPRSLCSAFKGMMSVCLDLILMLFSSKKLLGRIVYMSALEHAT